MARYWKFNDDNCEFEVCNEHDAKAWQSPVIVRNEDFKLAVEFEGQTKEWPVGEPLSIAGVEIDREAFEV